MTCERQERTACIVLVEDQGWGRLQPLTWLRPAADLIVGAWTIRERWARAVALDVDIVCRPWIAALSPEAGNGSSRRGLSRLWVRDRWLPDAAWARAATNAPQTPMVWRTGEAIVAVLRDGECPADPPPGSDSFWERLADGAVAAPEPPGGVLIAELSDLLREGALCLARDLDEIVAATSGADIGDGHGYMAERIRIGEGCRIDHGAVLDARSGPVVIGPGTTVAPFTWVRGPFLCRTGCTLLGGSIGGGSYLGPGCRVRGEVESTTFLGHANKAHDGFIGHSYVAEWVNLGALTTTSDLKNNYGPVHMEVGGRRVETGQVKVGSFIGDHAKTRIGTLLNTGSVIGVAANLFGEVSVSPKWIPDFAWGVGAEGSEHAIDRCLKTAATVMIRRGEPFTAAYAEALTTAFRESHEARQRALRPPVER